MIKRQISPVWRCVPRWESLQHANVFRKHCFRLCFNRLTSFEIFTSGKGFVMFRYAEWVGRFLELLLVL